MRDWYRDYEREGMLHCHVSWHVALWALERGDLDLMWSTIDTAVAPGSAWGPPINVLSDTASILYRAEPSASFRTSVSSAETTMMSFSAAASIACPNSDGD